MGKNKGISLIIVIFIMTILLMIAMGLSMLSRKKIDESIKKEKSEEKIEVTESISQLLNIDTTSNSSIWFTEALPKNKMNVKNFIFVNNVDKTYTIDPIGESGTSKMYISILENDPDNIGDWDVSVEGLSLTLDKSEEDKYRSYISNEDIDSTQEYKVSVESTSQKGEYIILIRIFHD